MALLAWFAALIALILMSCVGTDAAKQCSGTTKAGFVLVCGGQSSCCGDEVNRYCCDDRGGLLPGHIVAIVAVSVLGIFLTIWLILHYIKACCCLGKSDSNVPRIIVTQPTVIRPPGGEEETMEGQSASGAPPPYEESKQLAQ